MARRVAASSRHHRVQPFSARSAGRFGCCLMQTENSVRGLCQSCSLYNDEDLFAILLRHRKPAQNLCKTKFETTPCGSSVLARNLFVKFPFKHLFYTARLESKHAVAGRENNFTSDDVAVKLIDVTIERIETQHVL